MTSGRPRILFVAMADSIHSARWINQIADQGWDIHLFPCMDSEICNEFNNITIYDGIFKQKSLPQKINQVNTINSPFINNEKNINKYTKKTRKLLSILKLINNNQGRLSKLIHDLKPNLIHSLEIQHSGYLTLGAKYLLRDQFPPWIVTNWGSDIFYFRNFADHAEKIRQVLMNCDYYSCECLRDVDLAMEFGFTGKVLPILPNTGGFDLEIVRKLRSPDLTSERRIILLKGYHTWSGRALIGLQALELCSDILEGYTIVIYLANKDVIHQGRLFTKKTGIPVKFIPKVSHSEMLKYHGQARISIGLSISDGISTSFLEAIVMGSFPIQSCTGCADEWIQDGVGGFIVPAEDPDIIASAIRAALSDNNLVDRASQLNWETAVRKLDSQLIKPQVTNYYRKIIQNTFV